MLAISWSVQIEWWVVGRIQGETWISKLPKSSYYYVLDLSYYYAVENFIKKSGMRIDWSKEMGYGEVMGLP